MRRVNDFFMNLLYGDQPAGWDIAGRKEVIRTLKREDFIAYRNARYVANGTIVAVAGNFNSAKVVAAIKKRFGDLPKKSRPKKPGVHEHQTKPQTFLKFKESDQSHLVLGVRAFDVFDKRRYAIQVLGVFRSSIFGNATVSVSR